MSAKQLGLTLAEAAKKFNWSRSVLRYIVHRFWLLSSEDLDKYGPRPTEVENDQMARTVTLRDLFSALEKKFEKYGGNHYNHYHYKAVINHLCRAGFTRVDSVVMPPHTITAGLLSKLSRKTLLASDAAILCTLSPKELENQRIYCEEDEEKKRPRLKVADILAMKPSYIVGQGAGRTIALLEKLGFSQKDGPFMSKENDPRQLLVKSLVVEDGLTEVEANKFAEIAARRNWI